MATPRVLLFDLGGVLVDVANLRELPALLPEPMQPEALRRKWVSSPAIGRFECGQCSKEAFATEFSREWGLALAPGDFLERFASWVVAPYPGTGQLLAELDGRFTLACLSNTNAVHWEKVLGMQDLRPVLERPFLSYAMGAMKPSPAVYARVVRELECAPGEIAFFDDGPENVDGAARAGLSAHLTVGPDRLRQVLAGLGLL
jgi:HAD superfamily hydrolase (TIGR01509 family)